jgi:hypothetical protein
MTFSVDFRRSFTSKDVETIPDIRNHTEEFKESSFHRKNGI